MIEITCDGNCGDDDCSEAVRVYAEDARTARMKAAERGWGCDLATLHDYCPICVAMSEGDYLESYRCRKPSTPRMFQGKEVLDAK